MDVIARKYNVLATYSYLASLTLYILPIIYSLFSLVAENSIPFRLILVAALFLGLLITVGLQLKAGKTWAKVLVLVNVVCMTLVSLFFVPALFYSGFFTVLRILVFLALNLGTIYFLLKSDPQRAASSTTIAEEGA